MLQRSLAPYHSPFRRRALDNRPRFNQAFVDPGIRVRPSLPAVNIWTNENEAIVEAKLPGINPEDIDISIEGETLTVAGSRAPHTLEDGERYLRRERRYGKFSRTFRLPFVIDADQVEAVFDKGILNISLSRAEADKPKKIAVKAA